MKILVLRFKIEGVKVAYKLAGGCRKNRQIECHILIHFELPVKIKSQLTCLSAAARCTHLNGLLRFSCNRLCCYL